MRYLFIQGGLRRGAGASAALGSLWAAARRGSLQAQPSPAAGGAPRMAGRSLPPARSFSRPRRAAARRWPGSAGNALGGVPGGLTAPGHRAAPCTPRTAGSLHAACRPRRVQCAAPRQAGSRCWQQQQAAPCVLSCPIPALKQHIQRHLHRAQVGTQRQALLQPPVCLAVQLLVQRRSVAANGLGAVLARLSAHAHYCHQVGVIMHQAVLQRPQMRIFVPIIAQKKPGCATNTTGFANRSGGFSPRWRRRRDSNSRDAFDAYAISSRAPSTKLGDFSIFNWQIAPLPINAGRSSLTSHQRRLLYHKTGCASITFFQFRCIFCSGRAELSAPPGRCHISNIAFQARQAGWDGRGPGCGTPPAANVCAYRPRRTERCPGTSAAEYAANRSR